MRHTHEISITLLLIALLWPGTSRAQVFRVIKDYPKVSVPAGSTGVTLTFNVANQGKINAWWWWWDADDYRALRLRYTAPSGTFFEQVAGAAAASPNVMFGQEAMGAWSIKLTENTPGPAVNAKTKIVFCHLRTARQDLPISGPSVPELAGADSIMTTYMKSKGFESGALAIMRNGRLVYKKGYGWQDFNRTTSTDPDAVMRLGANTKSITAAAIRKMAAAGLFSLDDKVYDLLNIPPEAPRPLVDARVRDITIRHLLDHRSGLPQDKPGTGVIGRKLLLGRPASLRECVAYMWGETLGFAPGSSDKYSNWGYELLAAVIEAKSGMSYDAYIRQKIAAPLRISTMRVAQPGGARYANEIWYAGHGYDYAESDLFRPRIETMADETEKNDLARSPGMLGIVCSAPDLCHFFKGYTHTGEPKPDSLAGWSWGYTWLSNMPGTLTATRDRIWTDGSSTVYAVLFNERYDDGDDKLGDLCAQIDGYLDGISKWPNIDMFPKNGIEAGWTVYE